MGSVRLVRRAAAACALGVLACGCAPTGDDSAPDAGEGQEATIEWISDGDSLRLTNGSKVRLLQVDAPERDTDCYGHGATQALIALIPKGTEVTLQRDAALDDADTYGRLLRYVFVGNENVNLALVESGAAAPYFFRKERGRYAGDLLAAAKRARDAGRGLWGACPKAELNTGLGSVSGSASTERR